MKESGFSRDFMKAWSEHEGGFFYHKIADVPISMTSGMRFNKPKGVDYVACVNTRFCAIEWKLIKIGQRLPFNALREVQIETLEKVRNAGGVPLIMIGYYQDRESRVYTFTIDEFLDLERQYTADGRKSAPIADLDRYRISRVRVGRKMVWQFNMLPIRDLLGLKSYLPEQGWRPLTHREKQLPLSRSISP